MLIGLLVIGVGVATIFGPAIIPQSRRAAQRRPGRQSFNENGVKFVSVS
jgi:hypothetical protein